MAPAELNREKGVDRKTLLEYYNRSDYVEATLQDTVRHKGRKEKILQEFVIASGKPVLEIGCGSGVYADSFTDYVGLDISLAALGRGREKSARVVCADITAIPLRDSSVGAVFSFNVLEHVPRPDKVLGEVDRVLAEGGVVLLKDSWRRWSIGVREAVPKWVLLSIGSIWSRVKMLLRELRGVADVEWDRLVPDYTRVGPDFDAVSGVDEYSVFAFFRKRGYEALNLRRNVLVRLVRPYTRYKHWVIVRKRARRQVLEDGVE